MADCSNSTPARGASIVPHPREQLRQMRKQVAAAAQRLIELLDEIDGDPDYEPENDDEGFDADTELSGDEHEPELGALGHIDQRIWSWGREDVEMNGDEQDFSEGAEDEQRSIPGNWYGLGTRYVRDSGELY